jgi:hypothetical protein
MVTHSEMWHRYVPESGNWHDGTFTRWIAALSAAPNPCCRREFSLRHPRYDISARVDYLQSGTWARPLKPFTIFQIFVRPFYHGAYESYVFSESADNDPSSCTSACL